MASFQGRSSKFKKPKNFKIPNPRKLPPSKSSRYMVGHIKPACLALKRGSNKTVGIKGKNVKTVQEAAEQHSVQEYNLFNMRSAGQEKTIHINISGEQKTSTDGN